METIFVTGSRIKQADAVPVAPVTSISREQIESTGATTLGELLKVISSNSNSLGQSQTLGFAAGSSSINLRGLGSQYSLVLLNGRRIAPYGRPNVTTANIEPSVNLDAVPIGAVERVEILNNGGSAIYGSDAVAGVVNIITKKHYEGTTIEGHYGLTSRSDGAEKTTSFTHGSIGDGYSSLFFINYAVNDGIKAKDRYISHSSDQRFEGGPNFSSGVGYPSTVRLTGVSRTINLCPTSELNDPTNPDSATNFCTTDRNAYTDLEPPQNRVSLFGSVDRDLFKTDNVTASAFLQALINKSSVKTSYYPTPVSTAIDPDIVAGAANPNTIAFINSYNAAHGTTAPLQDADIRYDFVPGGPRLDEYADLQDQYVAGVKGNLWSWSYELGGLYTSDDNTDYGSGYVNKQKMVAALTTGLDVNGDGNLQWYNPFAGNGANSPELIDAVKTRLATRGRSSTRGLDVSFSGPLADLFGKTVSLAVGAERRFETYQNDPDSQQQGGGVLALSSGTPVDGSRATTAEYAELQIPIQSYAEIQVAVRHEDYSDFGSVTKPKFALKLVPTDWLVIRGGIDKGFRAPSLADLHSGQSTAFNSGYTDPARCSLPNAPTDYCPDDTTRSQLLQTTVGGNPALQPEQSRSYYLGFVAQPVPAATIGVNFFDVKITSVVTQLPVQTLIDENNPGVVQRGTPDPTVPNDPGPIININNVFLNGAFLRTRGFDIDGAYNWTESLLPKTIGSLKTSVSMTYMYEYSYADPATPQMNYLGTDNFGLALPRWKGYAQTDWAKGPYSALLRWNYVGIWHDDYGDGWTIGSLSTFDLQASVLPSFVHGMKVTLGIDNALDRMPPYASGTVSYSSTFLGYDPSLYSAVGRNYYLTASYSF